MNMNKIITASAICSLFIAASAMAQNAPTTPTAPSAPGNSQPMKHEHEGEMRKTAEQNPSCQNILNACKKAGFIQGQAKEDNGLWKDCFGPLVHEKGKTPTQNGKPVQVAVSQSDVQACHTAMAGQRSQMKQGNQAPQKSGQ